MNKKQIIIMVVCLLLVVGAVATALLLSRGKESGGNSLQGTNDQQTQNSNVSTQPSIGVGVGDYDPNGYGDAVQNTTGTTEKPTNPAKPTTPTTPTQKPTEKPNTTLPSNPNPDGGVKKLTWEEYDALDTPGQLAYMNSFPSMADFVQWFNKAKEEAEKDTIIVGGDGELNLGELTGSQS